MGTVTLVVTIAVVAVLVLLLAGLLAARRSRARRREEQRERSREEFGPGYERAAREQGSEEEGEKELRRRGGVERRVGPLSPESRARPGERWGEVERVFVDNPGRSIEMADRAISDVLHERNFVPGAAQPDEEAGKNLAATHPDVADDYREARRVRAGVVARSAGGSDDEKGSTEELRQAIRKYRAVYQRLVKQ